ncbi:hypothetical protein IV64_GL001702 [Lactiplantibacillus xiangfangensis]|uniref:Uncharacterized protein n=1 Tax=Lactiplantibacillus xiangfangensis TaxID=942150 RepID=A0A0R2MU74_9LACO|nr:hypothetical protein IV64_GL001702 [Lactiplantibacillus xiangfangensis]
MVLHKRKLLENYLLAVGALSVVPVTDEKITNFSDMGERLNEFTQAYYLILPYIPAKEHNYFAEYSSETCKMDFSADSYNKLASLLGKHILPTIRAEIDKL